MVSDLPELSDSASSLFTQVSIPAVIKQKSRNGFIQKKKSLVNTTNSPSLRISFATESHQTLGSPKKSALHAEQGKILNPAQATRLWCMKTLKPRALDAEKIAFKNTKPSRVELQSSYGGITTESQKP